jgi:hypothetical protein
MATHAYIPNSPAFVEELQAALTDTVAMEPAGCFVKTSQKSSKNDIGVTPVFTVADVLQQLTSSRDVLVQSFEKTGTKACQSIVVQPFRPAISSRNELRVFVENRRVVAISQQKWMRSYGLTAEDCMPMAEAVVALYDNHIRDAAPYYASCVLDVWVDLDSGTAIEQVEQQDKQESAAKQQQPNKAHLIEINPGEKWASSGSALFHWIDDAPVFATSKHEDYDTDREIVFRFVLPDRMHKSPALASYDGTRF